MIVNGWWDGSFGRLVFVEILLVPWVCGQTLVGVCGVESKKHFEFFVYKESLKFEK